MAPSPPASHGSPCLCEGPSAAAGQTEVLVIQTIQLGDACAEKGRSHQATVGQGRPLQQLASYSRVIQVSVLWKGGASPITENPLHPGSPRTRGRLSECPLCGRDQGKCCIGVGGSFLFPLPMPIAQLPSVTLAPTPKLPGPEGRSFHMVKPQSSPAFSWSASLSFLICSSGAKAADLLALPWLALGVSVLNLSPAYSTSG